MQQPTIQSPVATSWLNSTNARIWFVMLALVITALVLSLLNRVNSEVVCRLFDDYQTNRSETHLALMALGAKGLDEYKMVEGQICVPEKQKAVYLAAIKEQEALPKVFDIPKETKPNPFLLRNQQVQQELNRKKQYVRNMVLRLPNVSEVMFEMDAQESGSPFKPDQQSAAVMISMTGDTVLTAQHVSSIQGIVCGSFAAISPTQVFVTDANLGISYNDLSDAEQNRTIGLVNWQRDRREYYLEQLDQLKTSFPKLDITVEVLAGESMFLPQDKLTQNSDERNLPATQYENETADQITLNGAGTVSDLPDLNHVDTAVIQASYATVDVKHSKPFTATSEAVKIEIRVPRELIVKFELPDSIESTNQESEKFDALKNQILSKIHSIIPAELLANSPPISIYPKQALATATEANRSYIFKWLQIYWPVLAVALLGIFFISNNRSNQPPVVETDEKANLEAPDEQLQRELSDLIDNDPDAAAAVIKNWIRNAA